MENYDMEFLDLMKSKYKITLDNATEGHESQIIMFAAAWNVWKRAKEVYSEPKKSISKFMSDDHSRLDYIFQEFRGSKTRESMQLFLEFKQGIERHIRWEEEILFPLARKKLGNDSAMIDELIMQHNRIRGDINGISASPDARNNGIEADLDALLTSHDKMEEEGIYPWIDDYVDGKDIKEALSKMA